MKDYYPPVGFHFRVEFSGISGLTQHDAYFKEVSGISMELQSEPVKAGGANNLKTQLPSRTTYPNLILKRGMNVDSGILNWAIRTIEDMDIQLATVVVTLLNEQRQPLQGFKFFNVWPKKWELSNFDAERNALVMETLELVYQSFRMT